MGPRGACAAACGGALAGRLAHPEIRVGNGDARFYISRPASGTSPRTSNQGSGAAFAGLVPHGSSNRQGPTGGGSFPLLGLGAESRGPGPTTHAQPPQLERDGGGGTRGDLGPARV